MSSTEHESLMLAVHEHAREISALSTELLRLDREAAPRPRVVFVAAQVIRHRIEMALLQSRLEAAQLVQG